VVATSDLEPFAHEELLRCAGCARFQLGVARSPRDRSLVRARLAAFCEDGVVSPPAGVCTCSPAPM
jgi:hypothetical protein